MDAAWNTLRRSVAVPQRVAIVCANHLADRLAQKLVFESRRPVELLGIFDDRSGRRENDAQFTISGRVDDLIAYARENPLDHIILALPSSATGRISELTARLRSLPVDIVILNEAAFEPEVQPLRGSGDAIWLAGAHLSRLVERPMSGFGKAAKRAIDITLAMVILTLGAPFLALIALAIVLDSPGGVLFRQQRIGFNNRVFDVLKFRTMTNDAPDQEGVGGTLPDDPRVTRTGRVLRRFSLDELPQLLNVLKGDMSLVGPRPQAVNMRVGDRRYAEAVTQYIERHKVKPGMTGWAQVNGSRGGIRTLDKAAWAVSMDLEYIQNWSIRLDLLIIWRTIGMLLSGRDAV
ncbi:exopolysaccharide biosynthesis polyprenyl glycosylphosphotransferase [Falsiroseomonas sp. HC035]|uniref:exopolysaccharide biosynthesis polyprenyl glycosylphosphotransferase n=1 Tax=Falsiroseomonas sp. HC035 TaxID=3390999 RepID=UPI003D310980